MPAIDQAIQDEYALYRGDNVLVMRDLPSDSIHLMVTSIPFNSLYTYTDSVFDAGNVVSDEQFWLGLSFMFEQLYRVMMPGRIACIHCMDLPVTIEHDGFIGVKDFSGDTIRNLQKAGFIYHSKILIRKDPLTAATRTHAIGLAHKELVKDSAISRQGLPDYVIVVRKPGKNPEPITHLPSGLSRWIGDPTEEPKAEKTADPSKNKYSHFVWQRYAETYWEDINPGDTLQFRSVREEDDSRHLCPLQFSVIRRCIELWSNPNDRVFDPYMGIGSTAVVAIEESRRAVGVELKDTYWRQSVRNCDVTLEKRAQRSLDFDQPDAVAVPVPVTTLEGIEDAFSELA